MTAYTPEYIELVPNDLDKYVVAAHTPGLVTAEDGSITIYVQAGPQGSALAGTYVPPKIHRGISRP